MATKPKTKAPDLRNATPEFLTDELGAVRDKIKELTKQEGLFKEALKARLDVGETVVEGDNYSAQISQVSQERIDMEQVRLILSPEQLKQCTKTITFPTIRTVRKADAVNDGK